MHEASDMNVDFPGISFAAQCADNGHVLNHIVPALPRICLFLPPDIFLTPGSRKRTLRTLLFRTSFCTPRLKTSTQNCNIIVVYIVLSLYTYEQVKGHPLIPSQVKGISCGPKLTRGIRL